MKNYQAPNAWILTLSTADIITLSGQASGRGITCTYSEFRDMEFDASEF